MAGFDCVWRIQACSAGWTSCLVPVERFMALLSGLAAFSLMFLAAYSVTGREFFESPLLGYVD